MVTPAPVVGDAVFSPSKSRPLLPGLGLAVGAEDCVADGAAEAFSKPELLPFSVADDGEDVGAVVEAEGGGGVGPEPDVGNVSFSPRIVGDTLSPWGSVYLFTAARASVVG